ncbi:MAG: DUF3131 domain-containing protein [Myxococcota bacterium]
MIAVLLALGAHAEMPQESRPLSWNEHAGRNRHPGQNGKLSATESKMAEAAWQYFENNFEKDTCLYNSVDKYPSTTMWDTASAIGAMVAAFELGLIDPPTFDQRMSCLIDSLNQMELFRGELPNKAYQTQTLAQVDYNNKPGELGFSAIDVGRLLTWLAIVKNRYPVHGDKIDRTVLRWNFCNVVDRGGILKGAIIGEDGALQYVQEGRLGYEEYAALGFQLWGFDTTAASQVDPHEEIELFGVPIAYDPRDPVQFGAHTYITTEPYLLMGVEMNWDLADDETYSDDWQSDRDARTMAKRVYKAQVRRFRRTGIMTARTEHHVEGAPYFVYDALYSDGKEWPTISDTGEVYPDLAAVSSRAAVGLDMLFGTRYTGWLTDSIQPLVDPQRGIYEGYTEVGTQPIAALTANTNGIILESLLYKVQGKLYRDDGFETLWERVPNWEFSGKGQCLPGSRHEQELVTDRRGHYEEGTSSP